MEDSVPLPIQYENLATIGNFFDVRDLRCVEPGTVGNLHVLTGR